MAFNITTTGTASSVVFQDLGGRELVHPLTIDLQLEFSIEELFESESIESSLLSGEITITHNGESVTSLLGYRVRISSSEIQEIKDSYGDISDLESDVLAIQVGLTSLDNDKTEKGGYNGSSQDLKDEIGAIDGSETKIQNGTNTTVNGTGTTADPYQIDASSSGGITFEQLQILLGGITMFNSTGVSLNSGSSPVIIPMTNITGPNNLGYNIVSGSLVIPVSGWYEIASNVNAQGDNKGKNPWFQILRNGVALQGLASSGYSRNNKSSNFASAMSSRMPTVPFSAGDTIQIQWNYDGDSGTITTFPQEAWLTLNFKGN